MERTWLKAFIAAAAAITVALGGCARNQPKAPPSEPDTAISVLPEGTKIRLMLLQTIESGIDRPGTRVPMVVVEDVRGSSGRVAVARGAVAYAQVSRSRRGDPLRMALNQPSRLSLQIDKTYTPGGAMVPLRFPGGTSELKIERSMVGPDSSGRNIQALLSTPEGEQTLKALADSFQGGDGLQSQAVQAAIRQLGLQVGDQKQIQSLGLALSALKAGSLRSIRGDQLGTLLSLAEAAGQIGGRLGAMLKAPNIKAFAGTILEAETAARLTF